MTVTMSWNCRLGEMDGARWDIEQGMVRGRKTCFSSIRLGQTFVFAAWAVDEKGRLVRIGTYLTLGVRLRICSQLGVVGPEEIY